MEDQTDFDFEGPGGPVEGVGLDSTANTAGVLGENIAAALTAIERGETDDTEPVSDPTFAAFSRSLRERPAVARYLASRVHRHESGTAPDDVDEVIAALVEIGLDAVAPQFAAVLDREYGADEE